MDHAHLGSEDAWQHICALYADDATARDLLRRQDDEGLDVVLHLFGQWAASQGRPLGAAELAEADACVAAWRAQVVVPLRQVRRAMKTLDGAGDEAALQIRRQVQAAELAAERAELGLLCEWLRMR